MKRLLHCALVSLLVVSGCTGEPTTPIASPRYECWIGMHLVISKHMTETEFVEWYHDHVVTASGPVCIKE